MKPPVLNAIGAIASMHPCLLRDGYYCDFVLWECVRSTEVEEARPEIFKRNALTQVLELERPGLLILLKRSRTYRRREGYIYIGG